MDDVTGDIAAGVRAIWERSRETIINRVVALEEAAVALLTGELDPEQRRSAEREAHKLAGAAGTFGFWDASALAREAELLLQGDAPIASADVLRLSNVAVQLRRRLEGDPQAAAPAGDDTPPAAVGERRGRLVVLTNDAKLRDTLMTEARALGLNAIGAATAAETRGLLGAGAAALVVDLTADRLGIALLEELHVAQPELPVVVISAEDHLRHRLEAARLGGRGFLEHPARASQVIDLLRDALGATAPDETTIVAIDDDPELLALLPVLLEPLRARVIAVNDPLRALDAIAEHAPDLVVLDVDMPQLNGIELCRVLRNDPRWATIPVLFLTSRTDASNVTRMFEAGADDYVAKPVLGPELVARVRNRIERTRMLRLAADTDGLTGVATRRRGGEVLERFFKLAERRGQQLSAAVIDLDHFKQVNDRYGHLVGDAVLRRVAAVLSARFRGEDVVARWGGEEFVVGMYAMPCDVAMKRLNDALATLRREVFDTGERGEPLTVTFSAGVATFPHDGGDWASLYRAADEALGRAKADGRARVVGARLDPSAPPQTLFDVAIVDDDTVLVGLLEHALHTRAYRTVALNDGVAAIENLAGAAPALRARVLILDVGLPGQDGFTVLRALARDGVTKHTRVLVLTARSIESEVLQALELGAFDHIAKPFSIPVLMQRVQRAMDATGARP